MWGSPSVYFWSFSSSEMLRFIVQAFRKLRRVIGLWVLNPEHDITMLLRNVGNCSHNDSVTSLKNWRIATLTADNWIIVRCVYLRRQEILPLFITSWPFAASPTVILIGQWGAFPWKLGSALPLVSVKGNNKELSYTPLPTPNYLDMSRRRFYLH